MKKAQAAPAAFAELGIEPPLLRALAKIGFVEPSEIQKQLIPVVLSGRDALGQARTGTGKTAAFGLSCMQMVNRDMGLQLLVLVPTRELAVQVAAELLRLSEFLGLRIVPVYGGQRIKSQLHSLGKKPCVVVGTPGRLIDLLERGALSLGDVRFVVLDEVDRMLDIGFRDDIRLILGKITSPHQTVFVSATLSDEIKRLAGQFTRDAVEVNVSRDEITVEEVTQVFIGVEPWDKFRLLQMVLEREQPKLAIVFCNTKRGVMKLAKRLHVEGIDAREIHGDLVQSKRERVMERFRKHNLHVLVATDLASRGIDVHGITHIVNYDIPVDPEAYVHRIGRTARMGSFGKAITFVTREQGKLLTEVEKLINLQITEERLENFVPGSPPRGELGGFSPPPGRRPRGPARASPVSAAEPPSVPGGTAPAQSASPSQRPKTLGAKFRSRRRRL
ncbi:MAG TPA: DEAD/DEAH box helicase [Phycisphaerae bacterium]|nr:DEAD/DEAH box helicase [Phycisphaerae bacterium]HRY71001.1 DEAD/DEAH box helicase [Phycisphaerae bacterium]HSA29293.1 DEAD/DEAH box helicase [Phycisphaerae bacterium]